MGGQDRLSDWQRQSDSARVFTAETAQWLRENTISERHITIASVVDDMASTLAFYRALGLAIPHDADNDDYVVFPLADGIRMSWNTVTVERSFNPEWRPPSEPGRMGLSLRLDSADDVDAVHERLVALGFESPLPPFDVPWGNRHCRMLDPDGNAVDLFAEPDTGS